MPSTTETIGPSAENAKRVAHDQRSEAVSEEFRDLARQKAAGNTHADLTSAFGPPIEEPGGKLRWSVDTRDRGKRGLVKELTAPRRRIMRERADKMNAKPKVRLLDRTTGGEKYVLAELADTIGRAGNLRVPVVARGVRVESGPDGMLFRLVGGRWEPTGRKCLGVPFDDSDPCDVPSPQIAPDGGLWLRSDDGEWFTGGA